MDARHKTHEWKSPGVAAAFNRPVNPLMRSQHLRRRFHGVPTTAASTARAATPSSVHNSDVLVV